LSHPGSADRRGHDPEARGGSGCESSSTADGGVTGAGVADAGDLRVLRVR
jgi:hypothetical protein